MILNNVADPSELKADKHNEVDNNVSRLNAGSDSYALFKGVLSNVNRT